VRSRWEEEEEYEGELVPLEEQIAPYLVIL
jgi:hypothetical protein